MKNMCLIIVVFSILFKIMFALAASMYHVSDNASLILITNVVCFAFAAFGLIIQLLSKTSTGFKVHG